MNRAALLAFALLSSSLVACTGEATDDADDSDAEVSQTETDLMPREVVEKKKPKSEKQEYLVVTLKDVLVSSY